MAIAGSGGDLNVTTGGVVADRVVDQVGDQALELLRELHGEGTTIVVITHDHEVAAAMQRRIEIRDGRILGDTPTPS